MFLTVLFMGLPNKIHVQETWHIHISKVSLSNDLAYRSASLNTADPPSMVEMMDDGHVVAFLVIAVNTCTAYVLPGTNEVT